MLNVPNFNSRISMDRLLKGYPTNLGYSLCFGILNPVKGRLESVMNGHVFGIKSLLESAIHLQFTALNVKPNHWNLDFNAWNLDSSSRKLNIEMWNSQRGTWNTATGIWNL